MRKIFLQASRNCLQFLEKFRLRMNIGESTHLTKTFLLIALLAIFYCIPSNLRGQDMRRPVSTEQPMWLIHVDHPYGVSPQEVIDAIPGDIKPYVVLNLALTTHSFNGDSLANEWLEVCNQNDMWTMVQPSAGIRNSMSSNDLTTYGNLFAKYPNLIGFNFSEQTWGYSTAEFQERLELFADLLELADGYGGYLYVNDCMSVSNPQFSTIAKLRGNTNFRNATSTYADHFIIGDKTTQGYGYYDNESITLGTFLSGHAGHYAIRYDQYSWGWSGRGQVFGVEVDGKNEDYGSLPWFSCPEAVMGKIIVEHMMTTGATIIDGPEVAWSSVVIQGQRSPVFDNMIGDIFRRVLDKTIKIPTKQEVLERTKIAIVNDVSSYNTPSSLFTGLYSMDGELQNNKTWLKKTGRYPSIPLIYNGTSEKDNFEVTVDQSSYNSRWPSETAKVNEFNSLFPIESSGGMYVSRNDNKWFSYNPYINTNIHAYGTIPLKYNTCTEVRMDYVPHTFSVMTESTNKLDFYLNNYRTDKDSLWQEYPNGISSWRMYHYILPEFADSPRDHIFRTSVIVVDGCSSEPSYTITDLGIHNASSASHTYSNGEFTLNVNHNGPLSVSINCEGNETDRLSVPVDTTTIIEPVKPSESFTVAEGVWLEAECGIMGSLWNTVSNSLATEEVYVTIQNGYNSLGNAPIDTEGHIVYDFNVASSGDQSIWARVRTPSPSDDSFWVKIDNGSWIQWNNIGPHIYWGWSKLGTYNLTEGVHTLTVAYREDGAELDRLYIGTNTPMFLGGPSVNCPANQAPVANAGSDQTVSDSDDSGSESVTLNGSDSYDPDGSIVSYNWSEGESQIATGESPSVNLSVGTHAITLTVTDNEGASATDTVSIIVEAPLTEFWLDAECGAVGALWQIKPSSTAAQGGYVTISDGYNSESSAPTNPDGHITYDFNVEVAGDYPVWARVRAFSPTEDSFWLRMDNGNWFQWNNIGPYTEWAWEEIRTFSLDKGSHTLTVTYREDGTHMDKIYIGNSMPTGYGTTSNNCLKSQFVAPDYDSELVIDDIIIYPNPAKDFITIKMHGETDANSYLTLFDVSGKIIAEKKIESDLYNLDLQGLKEGFYFVQIQNLDTRVIEKIIKLK